MYAFFKNPFAVSALPQAVYDAIADLEVAYYQAARGRYTVSNLLGITRGALDLDLNGSTLICDHVALPYTFYIHSIVDAFVDEDSPTRNASHLTGTITAATTQLTMDAAEIMDVAPGERVTIVAGTNSLDPVEPHRYIQTEVLSVAGAVITFAAPLGQDIPTYASEAEFKTFVDPGLWYKIGPWGEDQSGANYFKGLGFDHGLLRYVGGRVQDVTLRNFHIENIMPTDADLAVGYLNFFTSQADRVTLRDFSVNNVPGGITLAAGCDDYLVDNVKVVGMGRCMITPGTSGPGLAFGVWGGDGITHSNIIIRGQNILLSSMEVSPINVVTRNLVYEVQMTQNFTSVNPGIVIQCYSDVSQRLENCSLNVVGSVGLFQYDLLYSLPNIYENLVIPGNLTSPFNFAVQIIEGTIVVGGVTCGPLVSDTETVNVPGGDFITKHVQFPKGFYKSGRYRFTTAGGADACGDGFGSYNHPVPSAWTDIGVAWTTVQPGNLTTGYFNLQKLDINMVNSSQATIEFEISYYPAPDDVGWVVT